MPKPTIPTIDELAKQATEVILRDGYHQHMIIGYQETGSFIAGIEEMHKVKAIRFAAMRDIGRSMKRQMRQYGKLTDVFFIAEAWLLRLKRDEIDESKPLPMPSESPNRVEVLIITHYMPMEDSYDVRFFEMLRAGDALDLSPIETDEGYTEISSDLIASFVDGWGK